MHFSFREEVDQACEGFWMFRQDEHARRVFVEAVDEFQARPEGAPAVLLIANPSGRLIDNQVIGVFEEGGKLQWEMRRNGRFPGRRDLDNVSPLEARRTEPLDNPIDAAEVRFEQAPHRFSRTFFGKRPLEERD